MIVISGFLAALKCTKFVFGRDPAPDPTGGACSAPRPSTWFRGPISKGEGRGEGAGKGREEGEKKGTGGTAPLRKFLDPPVPFTLHLLVSATVLRHEAHTNSEAWNITRRQTDRQRDRRWKTPNSIILV